MPGKFRTSSALLLSGARAGSLLAFVLATAMLSRALPPQAYGTFRQCWTVYLIVVPVASTAFAQSLFVFLPVAAPEARVALVRRTLLITAGIGMACAAVMAGASDLVAAAFRNGAASAAFAAFGVFVAASIPMQLADALFMSIGRAKLAAIFNVLNRTTVLIGLAVPVALFKLELATGIAVLAVIQLAALVGMWVIARRAHDAGAKGASSTEHEPSLSRQLRFAAPIVGATIFGALFTQLDKLVVSTLASPADFAVYSNGAFENPIVALVVAASSATAAAELVRLRAAGDVESFLALWNGMTGRIALALLPMGAFLFALAPEAVTVMFSAKYVSSASVFRMYMALTPVRLIAFSTILVILERNVVYLLGHVAACVVLAIVAPALLHAFGLLGPAAALIAGSYLLGGGFLFAVSRTLGVGMSRVLPYSRVVQILAASVAGACVARMVTSAGEFGPLVALGLGGVTFVFAGAAVFAVVGGFRPSRPAANFAASSTRVG